MFKYVGTFISRNSKKYSYSTPTVYNLVNRYQYNDEITMHTMSDLLIRVA